MRDKTLLKISLAAITISMLTAAYDLKPLLSDKTIDDGPKPPTIEKVTEQIAPGATDEETEPEIIDTVEPTEPDPMDGYTVDDIELAAKIVRAEAGNQDFKGKRLVAAVILNRIDSDDFPDTINDVVFQKNQFATTTDGALERAEQTVDGSDYAAVEMEIRDRTDEDIMYFTAGGYNPSGIRAYKYGDHYFCYGKDN